MKTFTRRAMLSSSVLGAGAMALPISAQTVAPGSGDDEEEFVFEVVRTEEEWHAMLSDDEYNILRKGGTELPNTSPLVKNFEPGRYRCRGCDLKVYESEWRVDLPGWVFFRHSIPNATMTGIDGPPAVYGLPEDGPGNMIEMHCRRCGSHLGHILETVKGAIHCIDGTALRFVPQVA